MESKNDEIHIHPQLSPDKVAEVMAIMAKYGKDEFAVDDLDFTFEEAVRLESLLSNVPEELARFTVAFERGMLPEDDCDY